MVLDESLSFAILNSSSLPFVLLTVLPRFDSLPEIPQLESQCLAGSFAGGSLG